jgi:hypothetical protein
VDATDIDMQVPLRKRPAEVQQKSSFKPGAARDKEEDAPTPRRNGRGLDILV